MNLVLAGLGLALDLCGAPLPVRGRAADPADAAGFVAVGDAEAAAGHLDTAIVAYREALALAPDDAAARRGLVRACGGADDLLLDGIARFQAGDLEGAARRLDDAAVAGDAPAAAGAHFFMGLIAYDRHDARAAVAELALAARDPAYADLAAEMARLARRDGRLLVLAGVGGEWDSNVQLVPDTPTGAQAPPQDDLADIFWLNLAARPFPALRLANTLSWKEHRDLDRYDTLDERAEVSLDLRSGQHRVRLADDFDYAVLGGESYLLADGLTVSYRLRASPALTLGAEVGYRLRSYRTAAADPFSGSVQVGTLALDAHLADAVDGGVSVSFVREDTRDDVFSDLAVAGKAALRLRLSRGVRVSTTLLACASRFDAAEPDGAERRDLRFEAHLDGEIDLGEHVYLIGSVDAARNLSTIGDVEYTQLVVRGGLVVSLGVP